MIAALRAAHLSRKSNEQKGVEDPEKAVAKQIERGRAYAEKRGWTISEPHLYSDDGISGAEFKRRPDFKRMMRDIEQKPCPFDVLMMDDEDRLGRNSVETPHLLKRIIDAGVRVFCVLDDREVDMSNAITTGMTQLRSIGAQVEREQASKRTYAAMMRKALAGCCTGGRVFGYRNVDHFSGGLDKHGRPVRSHVTLEAIPEERAVVVRIFTMYADGLGFIRIAKLLTAEAVPSPRGNGWAPGSIGEILHRSLYHGIISWNRSRKVVRGDTIARTKRPEADYKDVPAEHLRIIPEDLWQRVQARLAQAGDAFVRRAGGRFIARAGRLDGESPFLMSGFLTCDACHGPLGGVTQLHGGGPAANRRRVTVYACSRHRKRGSCDNRLAVRTDRVDSAVLTAITEVINPNMVEAAVDRALSALMAGRDQQQDRRAVLGRDLEQVDAGLARIISAITAGGQIETLVEALKVEERRKQDLLARLAQAPPSPPVLDAARIKRTLRELAADVITLLLDHRTPQTRAMLRKVLDGPITAEPVTVDGRKGYRLTGTANWGSLLDGDVFDALRQQPDGQSRDRTLS